MIKLDAKRRFDPRTGYTYEWRVVGIWTMWGYTKTERLIRVK